MPEISALGWFHTGVAIVALVAGFRALLKYKVIASSQREGLVFLVTTFLAAATALMIFQHGGFGVAHGLAVLTLGAIFVGLLAERTNILKGLSPYVQAMSYTACILFHMIPAITDGLLRLPVGDPVITSIQDPLLLSFYGLFLLCFVAGLLWQWRWIYKTKG